MSTPATMTPAQKLAALTGDDPFMCWLGIPSGVTAEIAAIAGFRLALIDLEHGPASVETAQAQLIGLRARGAAGIVRAPEMSPGWFKRILDLGPAGLMVPSITSVEEAERAIAEFKYPPQGRRGFAAGVIRATGYGADMEDWAARWNATGLLILQIESAEGLAAAPEIAALDGVDSLFFGPADYATDLGVPVASKDVSEGREQMRRIAQSEVKLAGTLVRTGEEARAMIEAGWDYSGLCSDVLALRNSMSLDLAIAKGAQK